MMTALMIYWRRDMHDGVKAFAGGDDHCLVTIFGVPVQAYTSRGVLHMVCGILDYEAMQ
jgi:hypothetical protein